MPQLIVSTFSSQIFWTLVGFFLIYISVSMIFFPKVEKVLQDRDFYVSDLLKTTDQLKKESDKLEEGSFAVLKKFKAESALAEARLISDIKNKNRNEKDSIRKLFSEKSEKEYKLLAESSEKVFFETSEKMEEMVKIAFSNICGKKES